MELSFSQSWRPTLSPIASPWPRLRIRAPLLALIALLGFACGGRAQQPVQARASGLDSIARSVFAAYPNVALSVVVLRGGTPLLAQGYGTMDRLPGSPPATAETSYRFGSVTKQFTAAAVLHLVEAGLIALDDPVTRFIPEYTPPGSPTISIRHLLTHTSGIPTYTEPPIALEIAREQDLSPAEIVAALQDEPLRFPPASRHEYSNSNYALLGVVIERASGQPYAQYVHERLLAPAGLDAISYCPPGMTGIAPGHRPSGEDLQPADAVRIDWPYAAGALCGTAPALARWSRVLASGEILPLRMYAQMISPAVPIPGQAAAYGYGVRIDTLGDHRRVWHTGEMPGYTAMLSRYPADDVSIAVLSNRSANPTVPELERKLAMYLFGIEEPDAPALTPTERARYVGKYKLDLGGQSQVVGVSEEEGHLVIRFPGKPPLPLEYRGDHTFVLRPDPRFRFEFHLQDGRATSFTYKGADGQFRAERITPAG